MCGSPQSSSIDTIRLVPSSVYHVNHWLPFIMQHPLCDTIYHQPSSVEHNPPWTINHSIPLWCNPPWTIPPYHSIAIIHIHYSIGRPNKHFIALHWIPPVCKVNFYSLHGNINIMEKRACKHYIQSNHITSYLYHLFDMYGNTYVSLIRLHSKVYFRKK